MMAPLMVPVGFQLVAVPPSPSLQLRGTAWLSRHSSQCRQCGARQRSEITSSPPSCSAELYQGCTWPAAEPAPCRRRSCVRDHSPTMMSMLRGSLRTSGKQSGCRINLLIKSASNSVSRRTLIGNMTTRCARACSKIVWRTGPSSALPDRRFNRAAVRAWESVAKTSTCTCGRGVMTCSSAARPPASLTALDVGSCLSSSQGLPDVPTSRDVPSLPAKACVDVAVAKRPPTPTVLASVTPIAQVTLVAGMVVGCWVLVSEARLCRLCQTGLVKVEEDGSISGSGRFNHEQALKPLSSAQVAAALTP